MKRTYSDYADPGLRKALKAAGGVSALARALGITHVAVLEWKRVPYQHIIRIEEITGVPRQELRPELYAPPRRAR
jgi:DNA-binding transcriptional regulator YdaS (Cro superfamily)